MDIVLMELLAVVAILAIVEVMDWICHWIQSGCDDLAHLVLIIFFLAMAIVSIYTFFLLYNLETPDSIEKQSVELELKTRYM